jgi:DNA-binding SARP family transcriptional activator
MGGPLAAGKSGAILEVNFRILGPPQVLAEGRSHALAPRHWSVLTAMLMKPNVPVSAAALAAHVWGESRTKQAYGTVRSYISKIDKDLGRATGSEVHISRQEHGYVLNIDPQVVDLHRFRALRRQAAAVAESGDHQHAALLLREADALWRGPALADLRGDWIARMRDSLEEERRAARIQCIEAELHLGRHAELIGDLYLLSEQYPLDEKITEYQMTALYRSGRQADALRVYREYRARLVEHGLEPGKDLAEHHQRILRHDPELAITPAYRRPGQARQPDTIPADLSDFVGRDQEVRLLSTEIEQRRGPLLEVLEGMAGAGKTSLAVHRAQAGGKISGCPAIPRFLRPQPRTADSRYRRCASPPAADAGSACRANPRDDSRTIGPVAVGIGAPSSGDHSR